MGEKKESVFMLFGDEMEEIKEITPLVVNEMEGVSIQPGKCFVTLDILETDIEFDQKCCRKLLYAVKKDMITNNRRKMLGMPKISRWLYR